MLFKNFVALALISLSMASVAGCARAQDAPTPTRDAAVPTEVAPVAIRVTKDVPFVPGGEKPAAPGQLPLTLDVYAPANARDLPVAVFFYGGGLTGGVKENVETICRALAQEGFVVAAPNYRLSPSVKTPTYMEDAAASVAWMHDNATKYGGNPKLLFVGGHSAGGYLAAIVGTDPKYLAKYNIKLDELTGVFPISGQMTSHWAVRTDRGLPITTILVDEYAPLFHVSKQTPPFFVTYCDHDLPLRVEEDTYFVAALKEAGNTTVQSQEFFGRDHGSIAGGFGNRDDAVRRAVVTWMRERIAAQTQAAK